MADEAVRHEGLQHHWAVVLSRPIAVLFHIACIGLDDSAGGSCTADRLENPDDELKSFLQAMETVRTSPAARSIAEVAEDATSMEGEAIIGAPNNAEYELLVAYYDLCRQWQLVLPQDSGAGY